MRAKNLLLFTLILSVQVSVYSRDQIFSGDSAREPSQAAFQVNEISRGAFTMSSHSSPPTELASLVRPTHPAKMQVVVEGGSIPMPDGTFIAVAPAVLNFDPPEIQRFQALTRSGGQPAAPANAANHHFNWEPWPGALSLTPRQSDRQTLILGSFFRYWRPETLEVKDAAGNVKEAGRDFVFNEDWGLLLNLKDGLGKPETGSLDISIEAALPRIDLIQLDAAGNVSVKKGETSWVCPERPEPDAGKVALASVFIAPWRASRNPHHDNNPSAVSGAAEYAITSTEILPIYRVEPAPPVNSQSLRNVREQLSRGGVVKIAFMGDSITVGAEATRWYVEPRAYTANDRTMRGSFIYQLRQAFPSAKIEPIHAFKGGETIRFAVNVYNELVAPENVDLVVIAFGANDMDSSVNGAPKTTPEDFKSYVGQLVDRARAQGAEVMLVSPLPRNPWFRNNLATRQLEYQRVLRELAEEKNVALAPVFERFQQLTAQGIPVYTTLHNWNNHPGDLGHATYAKAMMDALLATPRF